MSQVVFPFEDLIVLSSCVFIKVFVEFLFVNVYFAFCICSNCCIFIEALFLYCNTFCICIGALIEFVFEQLMYVLVLEHYLFLHWSIYLICNGAFVLFFVFGAIIVVYCISLHLLYLYLETLIAFVLKHSLYVYWSTYCMFIGLGHVIYVTVQDT